MNLKLRWPVLIAIAAIVALSLAACGSSAQTGSTSAAAAASASSPNGASPAQTGAGGTAANRGKLIACLKSHGVTLPVRPPGSGAPPNGSGSPTGSGSQTGSASQTAPGTTGGYGSGRLFGGGRSRFGTPSPQLRAALQACGARLRFRRQFRPDQASITKFVACVKQHGYNLPTPNFSGKGSIFPASIARDPKFQAAARACAADLRPSGAPGGSGAAAGGGPGGAGPAPQTSTA